MLGPGIKANWSSERPTGDMPCPRSGAAAERRYAMSTVKRGGQEEVCHVQGQERPSRSGAAPERRYAMSKVRSSGREEIPHIQSKEQDGALLEEP